KLELRNSAPLPTGDGCRHGGERSRQEIFFRSYGERGSRSRDNPCPRHPFSRRMEFKKVDFQPRGARKSFNEERRKGILDSHPSISSMIFEGERKTKGVWSSV